MAAPVLGGLMASYLEQQRLSGEVLIPVPLHSRRLRSRGYNQSNLLAREIGKRVGLPVHEESLIRANDSPPQVETRSREDRRSNVADSFQAPLPVVGRSVILVDDVSTTGSTLFACAAALKEAGANSVWGLVLARES